MLADRTSRAGRVSAWDSLRRLRNGDPVRVEVAIVGRNYAAFLGDAVSSALAQRSTPTIKTSVSVVDDGSEDDSVAVARDLGVEVSALAHHGVSAARNAAASRSTADFIAFLDADDELPDDYLTGCLRALARCDGDFTFTDLQCFGLADERRHYTDFRAADMRLRNVLPFACVFPIELVRLVRFREELRTGLEDYDFFLRVLAAGFRPVPVTEVAYRYRIHGRGLSRGLADDVRRHRSLKRSIALRNWRFMGLGGTLRWLTMPARWFVQDRRTSPQR